MHVDNISDHIPVQFAISYTDSITSSNIVNEQSSTPKPKIHWSKFTKDEINENYTVTLLAELINIDLDLLNGTENDVNAVTSLILTNSKSLAASIYHKKDKKQNYVCLPVDVKSARKQHKATFEFWKKSSFPTTGNLQIQTYKYHTKCREYRQSLRTFLNQMSPKELKDFVLHLKPTKNYFGNL